MELTRRPPRAGVVEVLGKLRSVAAIPYFVAALGEDFTRPAAASALRTLGPDAQPALLETATLRLPAEENESVSSRRRRRAALEVLLESGPVPQEFVPALSRLMAEEDAAIASLACRIVLAAGAEPDRLVALRRLIDLLPAADWPLGAEIEDCLVAHFDAARESIAEALQRTSLIAAPEPPRVVRALLRVKARSVR